MELKIVKQTTFCFLLLIFMDDITKKMTADHFLFSDFDFIGVNIRRKTSPIYEQFCSVGFIEPVSTPIFFKIVLN